MAINPTKLLPPSSGALALRSKTTDIGKKKSGGLEGQVLVIKTQVIKIEKLISRGYTLKLKEQKEEKKELEKNKRSKKEEELEEKKPPKEGKGKIPSLPKLGFFDRIKKFIGNMILAYFAVRLIDHLPKLVPFATALGNASEFLLDVGGNLLNGLVTFIDWGYKAYDATRGFLKNLGGDNFTKVFDTFNGAVGNLIETAIIAATVLATQGEGGVLDVGMDMLKDRLLGKGAQAGAKAAGKQVAGQVGRTAGMGAGAVAGIVAGAGLLASALGEGAFQVRKVAVKPIQNLEKAYKEDKNPLTKIGRGIALTMVRPLYGVFSTVGFLLDVVGAPFRYAIELLRYPFLSEEDKQKQATNLAKFDTRIREDLRKALNMVTLGLAFKEKGSFGNIFGNKGAQNQMMGKMAGGGITRGGKAQGSISRKISGKERRRKKTRVSQKPREIEFDTPGSSVGGEEKLFGIFPNPFKKVADTFNPFKNVADAGKNLGKTDYFGPILAITSKITLGQKPTEQDYKQVGLGINLLFSEGMSKGEIVGGVAAAYADGGFVDKKSLDALMEGGDITNWVARTFKDATETNAQKTLREIRENAQKEGQQGGIPVKDGEGGEDDNFDFGPSGGPTTISGSNEQKWKAFYAMGARAGAKYPELVAAQFALESGWGTALSGTHNYFGIKAAPGESSTTHSTKEEYNGKIVTINAGFKNFKSPQDAVNHLVNQWYKDYKGYKGVNRAADAYAAAQMLKDQSYATDSRYVRKLHDMLNRYGKIKGTPTDIGMVKTTGGADEPSGGRLPSGVKGGSLKTGPSAYIGGSTAYHIDTKFHKSVGMGNMVSAVDKLANAYSLRGRKIEFSNAGVSGEVWNPKASSAEKKSLLQRAIDAHSHSKFMRAEGFLPFDYYNPKKNDTRFGKSVEGSEILLPTFGGKVDVGTKYGGYGKSAEIFSGNKMVAMTGHGDVRYEEGGETLPYPHLAMIGERGREFVIDADSTAAIESTFPGFLDALNKAKYDDAINVLRNFATYEDGAQEEVIVIQNQPLQEESYQNPIVVAMGGLFGGDSYNPFEMLDRLPG